VTNPSCSTTGEPPLPVWHSLWGDIMEGMGAMDDLEKDLLYGDLDASSLGDEDSQKVSTCPFLPLAVEARTLCVVVPDSDLPVVGGS
jgi:hypothetical protein